MFRFTNRDLLWLTAYNPNHSIDGATERLAVTQKGRWNTNKLGDVAWFDRTGDTPVPHSRPAERVRTPMAHIRHVAICVFRDGDRILVAPGYDNVKNERFFRPLGGAVEFGESAEEALHREIREELGLEIENVVKLGVVENRFEYRGQPGHEVVFVFDASFCDSGVYFERTVPIREPGWDGPAQWLVLSESLPAPLYPAGLQDLLRQAV